MKVKIFGTLRQFAAAKEIEVEVVAGDTVRNVLQKLALETPALSERILDGDGNLQKAIQILVNGRSIVFLDGLDSPLQADDRLALFPAVGGG